VARESVTHLTLDKFEQGFNEILEAGGSFRAHAAGQARCDKDDQRGQQQAEKDCIKMPCPETRILMCNRIAIANTQVGQVVLNIFDGTAALFFCCQDCRPFNLMLSLTCANKIAGLCCRKPREHRQRIQPGHSQAQGEQDNDRGKPLYCPEV